MTDLLRQEKLQLEAAMQAEPQDASVRDRYFRILGEISRTYFGSLFARLPEIATPLLLRGASSDIWNMRQVFLHREYDVEVEEPGTILDLGAYAGYTAVFFANRFPKAKLIAVEPPGSNFDTLLANTVAYPNIRCLPAAVWHERSELKLTDFAFGDWGTYFQTASAEAPIAGVAPPQSVPAYTIADILEMHGWSSADLIKCSTHDGRFDVLLRPRTAWLDGATTLITRPGARGWPPRITEHFQAVLSEAEFTTEFDGDLAVFRRRARTGPRAGTAPQTLPLLPAAPHGRAFRLANLVDELQFYRFGYSGIQLAPNPPGRPLATLKTELMFAGHSRFRARVSTYGDFNTNHPHPQDTTSSVAGERTPNRTSFKLDVIDSQTGTAVLHAEHEMGEGSVYDWEVSFPASWGAHTISLSTESLGVRLPRHVRRSPAQFIDARFD